MIDLANSMVLVTGANGFIGSALRSHLRRAGHNVRAAVAAQVLPSLAARKRIVWSVTSMVQLTGRMRSGMLMLWSFGCAGACSQEHAADPLTEFRAVNTRAR